MNPFKKLIAIIAAMKAGWIAGGCPNCVVDDETESIFSCPKHRDRITELEEINQKNW
jgi:hypothetical protein